jgi:hypothetical protein
MTILVEATAPEHGHLAVRIHADVEIIISAKEAQQRVTRFVHQQVSSQMHGGEPTLFLGERAYWQVPIHLTFPAIGDAGVVGNLRVDTETGELMSNAKTLAELENNANEIANRFAFTTTR